MADSSEASCSSASDNVVSSDQTDLAAKRRKKYTAEKDKTKVSLFEHFETWRDLRKKLNLKTDKELAGVLLENYFGKDNASKRYIYFTICMINCWLSHVDGARLIQ